MSWDADSQVKLAREARAFAGAVPGFGIRCFHCGARATTYGPDENGHAITDFHCGRCTRIAVALASGPILVPPPPPPPVCKYCFKVPPLLGVWCGPCAIRQNELARDRGETPKEQAEATIAYIRDRMDRKEIPASPEIENQEVDLIDVYNQAEEQYDGF